MNTTENKMSTRRLIVTACNSFESVTGKKAKNATVADIEQWLGVLRGKGRSAGQGTLCGDLQDVSVVREAESGP